MSGTSAETRTANLLRYRLSGRGPNSFILASIVSGFTWYFTNQQIKQFNTRQQELITRVENEETADNFKSQFDHSSVENWEGKKVNLDGQLGPGRFFVKRSRGKQEGYLVLAPFIVNSVNFEALAPNMGVYNAHTSNRKFIVNLGWIPRSRKHLVFSTITGEAFGEESYEDRAEALAKQNEDGLTRDPLNPEFTVPVTNITAYVRKGESEDRLNGRVNHKESLLYKWIDLNLLTRVFRVFNEAEGETVYLEKTIKDSDELEGIPIPASKETVIEELKNQAKFNQNSSRASFWGATGLAFGVASWITFL